MSLHHVGLNFILPDAIYPGGSNVLRLAVHAVIVLMEVAILMFIGETIRTAFSTAAKARQDAEAAAVQLEQISGQRQATSLQPINARI